MSKVGIVTDSTNCLPPELIKKYGVRVVPVCMVINGKVYRDLIDISLAEFKDIALFNHQGQFHDYVADYWKLLLYQRLHSPRRDGFCPGITDRYAIR